MIDLFTTAVSVLADPPKNSGPDFGKASPLGLLVVVLLLIGVFILVWSMNRHLKRLPKSFDHEPVVTPVHDGQSPVDADTGKSASESSG